MNALQDIKLIPPQSEKKASHYFCNQKCDLIFAVMAAAAVAIGALIILGTLPGGVIAGYAVTGVGSFLFLISSVDFVRHCCSNSIRKPFLPKEIPLLPEAVESIPEVASSSPKKRKSLPIQVREIPLSPIMVRPVPLTTQEGSPKGVEIEFDEEIDSFLFDHSLREESYFSFPEDEKKCQQFSSINDRLTAIEKILSDSRFEDQSLKEDFENQSRGLEGIEQGLEEVEKLLSSVESD